MQMAAGRAVSPAGIADGADQISLVHVSANRNQYSGKMGIDGIGGVGVLNAYKIAVTVIPAARFHIGDKSGSRGINRRPASVGNVNGIVPVKSPPIPAGSGGAKSAG